MTNADIIEFVGLTRGLAATIESFRTSPSETKADILSRTLTQLLPSPLIEDAGATFDLGQGASLAVGEKVFLFLSDARKREMRPHATAEIREDGFYLFGRKVEPSNGSVIQPAMRLVQEREGHRNEEGEVISLSAWRQWHVNRSGRLIRLLDLKDPKLARRRSRFGIGMSPDELGL